MHPFVKNLLREARAVGVKAIARAFDSVYEDVDAGAKEVSTRVNKARAGLKDVEANVRRKVPEVRVAPQTREVEGEVIDATFEGEDDSEDD
jgi:hypothetical protein